MGLHLLFQIVEHAVSHTHGLQRVGFQLRHLGSKSFLRQHGIVLGLPQPEVFRLRLGNLVNFRTDNKLAAHLAVLHAQHGVIHLLLRTPFAEVRREHFIALTHFVPSAPVHGILQIHAVCRLLVAGSHPHGIGMVALPQCRGVHTLCCSEETGCQQRRCNRQFTCHYSVCVFFG